MEYPELQMERGLFWQDCKLPNHEGTDEFILGLFEYHFIFPYDEDELTFAWPTGLICKRMKRLCEEIMGPNMQDGVIMWFFEEYSEELYVRRRGDALTILLRW